MIEQAWISVYVRTRRDCLATSPRKDLRATVYRMDALQPLIDLKQWGLELPLVVRELDVRRLQLGLSGLGADIKADGVFGRSSADHVRNYQATHGLPATGVADPAMIAQLVA